MEEAENPLHAIDERITTAVRALVNKPSEDGLTTPFKNLLSEVSALPCRAINRPADDDRFNIQKGLAAAALAALQCAQHGATTCFLADSTKMSEAMQIGLAQIEYAKPYPDLTTDQRRLLSLFQREWNNSVQPLLAEKMEAYGTQKLAAEGFTRIVREWFDAHHNAHLAMMDSGDDFMWNIGYTGLLEAIQAMNASSDCTPWLATLSNPHASAASITNALEHAADTFTTNVQLVNESNIDSIKEQVLGASDDVPSPHTLELRQTFTQLLHLPPEDLPTANTLEAIKCATHTLRESFRDLVETPFYDVERILNQQRRPQK